MSIENYREMSELVGDAEFLRKNLLSTISERSFPRSLNLGMEESFTH